MTNILDPVLAQIGKLWARVDVMPAVRWGTVTDTTPLAVQLDGDAAPLPFPPASAIFPLREGARVLCVEQNRRVTVISADVALRGTTAQRDATFGVPSTDPERVSLANRKITWFNTDLGWEEGYYAPSGLSGLTAKGLVAGVSASWYPTGLDGPEMTMEPTAAAAASSGNNLTGWTGNVWRRGGAAAFDINGTYQGICKIPGYYDLRFWTTQQNGSGTANYFLRHVNAAGNAVPRFQDGLAYTLVSTMLTYVHGDLPHELMLAGDRFDTVCQSGALSVHVTAQAAAVRGQMGARYRGPALVTD
ncbi:hypothetical protein [Microbacterium sp. MYb72]|uniref:hypothetical protein n=1 Tax=Microbacterium sp. MYb72 TaxID=1848693 RepID=UPI0011B0085F|nr:hypothetical protein [Microbacterium sp. MYb72]